MVGDEGAVAGQVLDKELQFLQHFLLGKRIEFTALCLLQKGRSREQCQSAGSHQHRFAMAEDLCGMDRMLSAVGSAGNTVQEGHPVFDFIVWDPSA